MCKEEERKFFSKNKKMRESKRGSVIDKRWFGKNALL